MNVQAGGWRTLVGAVAGALVGAVSMALFMTEHFELYGYRVDNDGPVVRITDLTPQLQNLYVLDGRALDYQWLTILAWAAVGLVLGFFLGLLAVAVLDAVNRHGRPN